MMRRREFITLSAVRRRRGRLRRRRSRRRCRWSGFCIADHHSGMAFLVTAFRNGLKDAGYIEGGNVAVEYRWAEGQLDRLPALAADLVNRQVAVIATDTRSTLTAKAATTTIPIVFITGGDPVKLGFVS